MTRILLAVMWLLHWLPLPLLAALGRGLGLLLYALVHERRRITLINLGLCFPQLSPDEKSALARRHFAVLGRSLLELGVWWWAAPERIKRLVRLEGEEHLQAHQGKPVILLAPHFVALDAGGARLNIDYAMVSIYAKAKNRVFDGALRRGRERFGKLQLVARTDGVAKVLRPLRAGTPFYYLPDMDYGRHDAVFVPFFGYPAATITGLSRLAKISGAVVLPVITRMVDDHYVARIGAAWTDFPTDDVTADTRRMNAYLETEIMQSPEQYYWLHRRFKTRPPAEKGVY